MAKKSKNSKCKEQRSKQQDTDSLFSKETPSRSREIVLLGGTVHEEIYGKSFSEIFNGADDDETKEAIRTIKMCEAGCRIALYAGSYSEALKTILEIDTSGDLLKPVPGRVMAKVIFFLVIKKIFNEPYELDLLFEEAEIVMSADEIAIFRQGR